MDYPQAWLICQNGRGGRKDIFLVQDAANYYIIYAYESLTRKKRDALAREDVSEPVLKGLEARYDVIPKNSIRAVAIGGYCAGDSVYLYPEKGKRMKFQLRLNHQKDQVDDFFGNMKRFESPVDKKQRKWNDQAWRREGRDQTLFEKCRYVPWILTALSILFNVGYARNQTGIWYIGCIISVAVPLLLTILYPSYFTLLKSKRRKKLDAWDLEMPIFIHFFVMIMMPALNWLDEWMVLKVSLICGATAVIVLILFSEEFQREKAALLAAFFVAGLGGSFMVGQVNRVFDESEPRKYVVVAEDVYKSGGKSTSYHCVVMLPEEGEVNLRISHTLYEELQEGEQVLVVCREGALGIEYANVYALE